MWEIYVFEGHGDALNLGSVHDPDQTTFSQIIRVDDQVGISPGGYRRLGGY